MAIRIIRKEGDEILRKKSKKVEAIDEKIKCPIFVIGSWKDRVFGGNSVFETAQKLKCGVYMYEGYGHAVYDEAPDCVFGIYDFLQSDN